MISLLKPSVVANLSRGAAENSWGGSTDCDSPSLARRKKQDQDGFGLEGGKTQRSDVSRRARWVWLGAAPVKRKRKTALVGF